MPGRHVNSHLQTKPGARGLRSLVSPFGVVSQVTTVQAPRGLPALAARHASVGTREGGRPGVSGSGLASDARTAWTLAVAEGAERYAGLVDCIHGGAGRAVGWTWGRAAGMTGEVLDLTRVPRCTDAEYAAPGCPLVPLDPDAVIRWVRGIDVRSGTPTWVPAIMAVYGLPDRVPAEYFWYAISTGYAVHTDPCLALLAAVCEVIERDSVEVLWSQMLPLPRLAERDLTGECHGMLGWLADHFIRAVLFDATTDLGVPTAYCVSIADHNPVRRQGVSCATGVTLGEAAGKALRDTVIGAWLSPTDAAARNQVKTDFATFTDSEDSFRYMALPEHGCAFSFLLDGCEDRPSPVPRRLAADPEERLCGLIDTLAEAGVQAVAIDRTTPELANAGLTAFSVVIPDLQPMTTHPLARHRAHPRLYSAPARMGYRVLPLEELNPWPNPYP
jgi:ribosomal protein S12 methylthiotransferase accessory factor